jgi:hypothetical protein
MYNGSLLIATAKSKNLARIQDPAATRYKKDALVGLKGPPCLAIA